MSKQSDKLMGDTHELATYLVNHAMDKAKDNGMLASFSLGMAYAALMSSNHIPKEKAVELVLGVYERAQRMSSMGGLHETH